MTTRILTKYKQKIEVFELEPSGGGCFELSIDGDLVYSKLQSGQFPDEKKMVAEVGKRV